MYVYVVVYVVVVVVYVVAVVVYVMVVVIYVVVVVVNVVSASLGDAGVSSQSSHQQHANINMIPTTKCTEKIITDHVNNKPNCHSVSIISITIIIVTVVITKTTAIRTLVVSKVYVGLQSNSAIVEMSRQNVCLAQSSCSTSYSEVPFKTC